MDSLVAIVLLCLIPLIVNEELIASRCCKWPTPETLSCSMCGMEEIPHMHFPNITSLYWDKSFIVAIKDDTFIHLKDLRQLYIRDNYCLRTEAKAFAGLGKLEILDTRQDQPFNMPIGLFKPLKSLKTLKMGRFCNRNSCNSEEVFIHLSSSLEFLELAVDENFVFGEEFAHLNRLQSLVLNGYDCSIGIVNNETFRVFSSSLETIEIRNCRVDKLGSDAFSKLVKLKTLNLACSTGIELKEIDASIKQMPQASLQMMIADGVRSDPVLNHNWFDSPKFVNLTHLSLRGVPEFFNFKSLTKLQFLNIGGSLANIINLDFKLNGVMFNMKDMAINSVDIFQEQSSTSIRDMYCGTDVYSDHFFRKPPSFITIPKTTPCCNYSVLEGDVKCHNCLNFIYANGIKRFINEIRSITFVSGSNILYIDASGMSIKKLHGPIEGATKLQGLEMSGCEMEYIEPTLLDTLPSLKYLNISNNKLNYFTEWSRLFRYAHNITILDLSSNKLHHVPEDIFEGLTSLKIVKLNDNYLGKVFFDMTNNNDLQIVDLSDSSLKITSRYLDELEYLQKRMKHTLQLKLQGNLFTCYCENIFLLKWLYETSVKIHELEAIQCKYKNFTHVSHELLSQLEWDCSNDIRLATLMTPLVSLAVVLSIVASVHNYRWTLKWRFYLIRRRIFYSQLLRQKSTMPLVDEYTTYHAFVSYHHENDYIWVQDVLVPKAEDKWGLKLCIGQRDFLVGIPIAENICKAIDKSRYIILVITPSFVSSEWCDFEMHMALVKGRRHLVIVYKEEVNLDEISRTLKGLMSSVNYIEYSKTSDGNALFWQRLKDKLTSHVNAIDT